MKPRSSHKPKPPDPLRAAKAPPQPVPRTTAQQGADFTAEGAPPPGLVGTDVPDDAGAAPPSDHGAAAQ